MTFKKSPEKSMFRKNKKQHWILWRSAKKTRYGAIYELMPGEIFENQTSAGKRKKDLIEEFKANKRKYMRSTIVISKLYIQCPECKELVPDGMFDSFYEICNYCSTDIHIKKEIAQIKEVF